MGTLLCDGKYQVLESLLSEAGYSASICIDVETKNDYKEYIFNIYSDPAHINTFLPLYHGLMPGVCGDFRKVIPGNGSVMAIFDYNKGIPLEDYLYSLKKDDYPARAQAVGSLLDSLLVLDALPPIFAVSALSPPYTVYDKKTQTVRLNYFIKPRNEAFAEEIRALLVKYLEIAFVKNRYLPEMAAGFLESVRSDEVSGFVPICSAWRRISAAALEEHDRYKAESFFGYIKRRMTRKARQKAENVKKSMKL